MRVELNFNRCEWLQAWNLLRLTNVANQKSVCRKAEMRKCIFSTLLVIHRRGKHFCNKVGPNHTVNNFLKMFSTFLIDCIDAFSQYDHQSRWPRCHVPFCKGPIVNHALKLPARCPAVVPEWTTLRWHNTPGRSNSN